MHWSAETPLEFFGVKKAERMSLKKATLAA